MLIGAFEMSGVEGALSSHSAVSHVLVQAGSYRSVHLKLCWCIVSMVSGLLAHSCG